MLKTIGGFVAEKKDDLLNKYRYKIREKAITATKSRLALARKNVSDFTEDELEVIVSEEEAKIIAKLKAGSLLALLIVLGIN